MVKKKNVPVVEPLVKSTHQFPVVGIGASAGGLDAFRRLLKSIPVNSGIAYVLVQHLDPNHESLLPEILQKVTSVPVLEISDDIKVEPDHIYIIPSNKMLVASDGVLELSARPASDKNNRNLPIDHFFASLAEVHQSHAIGVVLSGTASDGTLGLKAIKDHGGLTFAQDEASAIYPAMPQSAVDAGVVDFILTPEEIPEKIIFLSRRIQEGEDRESVQEGEVFKQILLLLRIRKGTDFTYYKQTTVRRRIFRRMALNKNDAPSEYLKYLRVEKKEQDALFQDLLIPVTSFFRDPKIFSDLCEVIFHNLIKTNLSDPIRIWVAGCSTGEEVYSLAICLKEYLGDKQIKVQLFASDLSEPAIAKARAGLYSKSDVDAISPQRLRIFFTKHNGKYQAIKEIRDMCVFAVHNFLKDPPFGKLDFISCRNVLIYMEPYLQKKAFTTFHYALNPGGLLWLGRSETTSSVPALFSLAPGKRAKKNKFYIRKDSPARFMQVVSHRNEQTISDQNFPGKIENARNDFHKSADDLLLTRYTPPGAVVNGAMEVVHFRGNTSAYLELSPGKPNLNILKLAKSGLAFELRNILHKAKKEKQAVRKNNIPLEVNGEQQFIGIEAVPLQSTVEPHYLILFHDGQTKAEIAEPKRRKGITQENAATKKNTANKDLHIKQLLRELAQLREDLHGITEDQEASNEELQSANEELLSGSEELQSLNEELETSKEELQSTIEELTVVNQEMLTLNEQITESRDYAVAIVETISQPLLILDKKLRIKSANLSFYKTFLTNETETEGKLIYELANGQWANPQLHTLLEKILPERENFSGHEVELGLSNIGVRKLVFNGREMKAAKGAEKSILLAIDDVTEARQASRKIEKTEERYRNLIYSSPSAIGILKGEDMVITIANDAIIEIWGKGREIMGKKYFEVLPELAEQGYREVFGAVYKTGTPFNAIETPVSILQNGTVQLKYYNFLLYPQRNEEGEINGIGIIATEVTPQALLNKKIQDSEENFRQLAELMPDKVSTADPDGNIIYYNSRWVNYTGYRLAELKESGWKKIVHPDDVAELARRWAQSIQKGTNFSMEFRLLNKSTQYRWHLCRSVAVRNEQGEITRWIASTTEVQEQKEIREQLEREVSAQTLELTRANEALEQKIGELNKMNIELESFTYVSSHDLQEPLRKIQTFASHLLQKENENLSDSGKDYFKRMQAAAKRMQTLIEDLLKFSRASTGERVFENTDLAKIIQQVKFDFKEEILEKHAVIEIGKLCYANIIPYQFSQLMANLIGNALKFSKPETPPHISIKSDIIIASDADEKRLAPDREYCHIQIRDNGIGFEQQYSDRIFEVFQRLHGRDQYPGTGIGLAIVKKIIENHAGFISASSELNQGTTFNMYVPASQEAH